MFKSKRLVEGSIAGCNLHNQHIERFWASDNNNSISNSKYYINSSNNSSNQYSNNNSRNS